MSMSVDTLTNVRGPFRSPYFNHRASLQMNAKQKIVKANKGILNMFGFRGRLDNIALDACRWGNNHYLFVMLE